MSTARRLRAALGAAVVGATALSAVAVIQSSPARATSFAVTSTADAPDAAPGDGACATADGACTLRAAVQESQAHPGPTTIELAAGTYTLGSLLGLHSGALTVHGADRATTVIDGGGLTRLFDAASGTSLTLQHVTLANGHSDVEGGALRGYDASLTLDDVAISSSAAEANGGGLFAAGSAVTINGSAFDHDTGLAGGALAVMGGTLSIAASAFTNNLAFDVGGAVSIASAAGVGVTGATFTNNTAEQSGGAVYLAGAASSPAGTDPTYTIGSSTFTGNDAFAGGGGAIGTDGMVGPGAAARLTLADSTFDTNSAGTTGGAVSSAAPVTTTGLTLSHNSAPTDDDVHVPVAAPATTGPDPATGGGGGSGGGVGGSGGGGGGGGGGVGGSGGGGGGSTGGPGTGGGPAGGGGSPSKPVNGLSGLTRIGTAIAISKDSYADASSRSARASSATATPAAQAGAVILTREDLFADALAGAPLAVARNAPLLLTHSAALDPEVEAEIVRVLPTGGTVDILGGDLAIAPAVAQRLTTLGSRWPGSPDPTATPPPSTSPMSASAARAPCSKRPATTSPTPSEPAPLPPRSAPPSC